MRTKDTKLATLRSFGSLRGASDRDLLHIARLVDLVDVPPGKVMMMEGEPALEGFWIVSGEVGVSVSGRLVAVLGEGDFAGELALLDRGPRSATLTALVPTRVLAFDQRRFRSLRELPLVGAVLARQLATRLRAAQALANADGHGLARIRRCAHDGVHAKSA